MLREDTRPFASIQDEAPHSVKVAADHLRAMVSEKNPFIRRGRVSITSLGAAHATALVAGSLGYRTPQAMYAAHEEGVIDINSQWLGQAPLDMASLADAAQRMKSNNPAPEDLPQLAKWIADGLTPACIETGIHSVDNVPVGHVEHGEEAQAWVHPSAIGPGRDFDHCRCCGSQRAYAAEDLDDQGLCQEHRGEFDLSPEEEEDWDSFAENLRNRDL